MTEKDWTRWVLRRREESTINPERRISLRTGDINLKHQDPDFQHLYFQIFSGNTKTQDITAKTQKSTPKIKQKTPSNCWKKQKTKPTEPRPLRKTKNTEGEFNLRASDYDT